MLHLCRSTELGETTVEVEVARNVCIRAESARFVSRFLELFSDCGLIRIEIHILRVNPDFARIQPGEQ